MPGQLNARCRDGQAARKHIPHDQHRLVNEMAIMSDRMGINIWEVIDAAATKPFGFMAFYPGQAWAATAFRSICFICPVKRGRPALKHGSSNWPINGHMPHFVVEKSRERLTTAESR